MKGKTIDLVCEQLRTKESEDVTSRTFILKPAMMPGGCEKLSLTYTETPGRSGLFDGLNVGDMLTITADKVKRQSKISDEPQDAPTVTLKAEEQDRKRKKKEAQP